MEKTELVFWGGKARYARYARQGADVDSRRIGDEKLQEARVDTKLSWSSASVEVRFA
jgi:hypothetical protein